MSERAVQQHGVPGDRPGEREAAQAWESLFRTQVVLLRRFAREDVWGPVSLREYDVLFALSTAPPEGLRLRDLAATSLLTQPSLSRLVERLESGGLVVRGPVPGDARGVAVRLTEAGRELQRQIGRRHVRSISRLVGGALTREQTLALRDLCDALRRGLPEGPDDAQP